LTAQLTSESLILAGLAVLLTVLSISAAALAQPTLAAMAGAACVNVTAQVAHRCHRRDPRRRRKAVGDRPESAIHRADTVGRATPAGDHISDGG
jgi:hypothetical protein